LVATYEIAWNLPAYDETPDEYTIQGLVGYYAGKDGDEDLFRVAWTGYVGQDTWEPESGLPPELVLEFRTENAI
jgi:hypothetical protein